MVYVGVGVVFIFFLGGDRNSGGGDKDSCGGGGGGWSEVSMLTSSLFLFFVVEELVADLDDVLGASIWAVGAGDGVEAEEWMWMFVIEGGGGIE